MTKPTHDEHQQFLKLGSKNKLFYGDNWEILKRYVPNESIDLIYLDPPFNSKADYNILFRESSGEQSTAQIQAFSDFWHWDEAARKSYEYLTSNEVDHKIANLAESLHNLLGKNDMTAYLFMMTARLIELHRVLKPSGSLFLHCDPNASHYLKLILDGIFEPHNFRNEIIWRRAHPKGHAFTRFASNHDILLVYAKDTKQVKFKMTHKDYDPVKVAKIYNHKDSDGRLYTLDNLLNPNINRPNLTYEFKGITRVWRWTKERMMEEDVKGRIIVPKGGEGVPRYKRYLDEQEGVPVDDIWDDIDYVKGSERVGYPTQKPLELVERIINSATNEGDWVLDPFCGCGTAVIAAEKLRRHWVGIDVTWLAVNIMKTRLKEMFPYAEFEIEGEPKDIGAAKELARDRYQFQWWALSLIHARPVGSKSSDSREGKKGADEGVDGWLVFRINEKLESIVVQVKSGHVGVKDIRELRDTISRQKAAMGIFITLEEPTSEMIKEVKTTDPYVVKSLNQEFPKIQILTIKELLESKLPNVPQTASAFPQAMITKKISGKDSSTLDDFAEE